MDINEYAASGQALYEDLAKTVTEILEQAVGAAGLQASRPQSQYRAKNADRLRARLQEKDQASAPNIEEVRKDLAGCRLIFYTNGDLNEFLQSDILRENFDIDFDSSRIHHPVAKDGSDPQFRGYNLVVKLKENRTSLPEYGRFAGLRCEVQLQTILNHAWAETSHDIVYKQPIGKEFARKALGQIEKRFRDIMLKYLVPAGYEIDKAKQDFESLLKGKPIFEKGPLRALKDAGDNNERWGVLTVIQEHYLPNHDDPRPLVPELLMTVEEAINRSRGTPAAKIQMGAIEADGWTGQDVTSCALDLLGEFLFVDPEATFDLLVRLMEQATGKEERERILQSAERLATVPIRVVRMVGGEVQLRLARKLEQLGADKRSNVRDLVLKICEEVLKPDVSGSSGSYRTVTFERGTMPATKEIEVARSKVIDMLHVLYKESSSDIERLVILQHLSEASRMPMQGGKTNELVEVILRDSLKVAAFMCDVLSEVSFEIKKAIEYDAWNMYRILCLATFDGDDDRTLHDLQERLRYATLQMRDALADDTEFEIFKTLASLESVYPPAWDSPSFDFRRDEAWRSQRIELYLAEFTSASADQWWGRMERSAAFESMDLAAYGGLQELLGRLCEEKPDLVFPRLDSLPENVARFLPLILSRLARSSREAELRPILERWAKEGKYLCSLTRHYRASKKADVTVLSDVFKRAVEKEDCSVAIELVTTLVDTYGEPDNSGKALLLEVVAWLESQGRTDWVDETWHMEKGLSSLAKDLTQDERVAVLGSLVPRTKADHHIDYLLTPFAEVDLPSVLGFFGERLKYAASSPRKKNYDAIPRSLTQLKPLRAAPLNVLETVLGWLRSAEFMDHEAGSFVYAVFPKLPDELAVAMVEKAAEEKQDAWSVLEILASYDGAEKVFEICREMVGAHEASDREFLKKVGFVLNATGTVSGEFGFVDAYIAKKEVFEGWLADHREPVVSCARQEIASLDRMIASEQNRSEQRYALERLNWGESIDDDQA